MDPNLKKLSQKKKELLYTKAVIRSKAVELLCKCIHMDDYGNDAVDLKYAFDDTIKDTYEISLDRFVNLMSSMCTDRTSVNMGIYYTGACTQIKNNSRDWLLKIHCANHYLELAIGTAYTGQPKFKIADTLLLDIYQIFKNSGKLRWLLTTIALNLDVTYISFVQSHGTRFQNHKYKAIKALIINFVPLYLSCKNMIAGGSESCHSTTTLSTLKGFFDKLQSYKYLDAIHFYWQAISIMVHLSFTMQKQQCLITGIVNSIDKGKEKIMELQSSECKLPFPSVTDEDGNVKINTAATNLPANQNFKNQNQLSEKQKAQALKCITIHKESITVKEVF